MVFLHPGSHAYRLFTLLSIVGEYPFRSLAILGSEKVYRRLVHKLSVEQEFRNPATGEELTVAAIQILGSRDMRTIRLAPEAASIIRWIGGEEDYNSLFSGSKFSNNNQHRERNHRIAETVAMCLSAGIECRPHCLPQLQCERRLVRQLDTPSFYMSRAVKQAGESETSKTAFTRAVGALILGGEAYPAYNTRNAEMRWTQLGEQKALFRLQDICSMNFACPPIKSAVLFGDSAEKAMGVYISPGQSSTSTIRLDSIYWHIHYVSNDSYGQRFLRIMSVPEWKEILLEMSFREETRSYDRGTFEYDAFANGMYQLSFLDCDVARLSRFREAAQCYSGQYRVLCYSHQEPFLREFLGKDILIKPIPMETVEELFEEEGEYE